MNNWKNNIPEGTYDILFEKCVNKRKVEESIRQVYIKRGYKEVITPTLEFYDAFNFLNQPISQQKMYKLFDNSGRILVLKPDGTIPIARIAASKIKDYPIKLCYTSNIFRVNESLNGKNNEITQSGIEIIGIDNLKAEVDIIVTAINALLEVGIEDFKIEIGQCDFYKSIIEEISFNKEQNEILRELIESKNFGTLKKFLNEIEKKENKNSIDILKMLPEFFGGLEVLEKAEKLTNNKKAIKAIDNIRKIYKALEEIGLERYLTIDLGMVQNINYYTGVIFRGYIRGIGEAVLSGGRYDNLIKEFGKDLPATGLAINIDSIIKVLSNKKGMEKTSNKKWYIYYQKSLFSKAYKLSEKIRSKGDFSELSLFDKEEDAINFCEKNKIENLIILREEENEIFELVNGKYQKYKGDISL